MHSKVVIIGSGPAGLTAALYAARANLEPLVVRGLQPGGLITTTNEVENYPGFPESISGFELADSMEKQAGRFGAQYKDALITAADLSQRPFTLTTDAGETITADTLIISTGASPRHLGIPGEEEYANRGVSYCATCDGFFFRDKRVVVVGGGNSAMDEGLFLTRFVSKLYIVHRRDQLRADPILQERAFENPKIEFIWNTVPTEVLGDDRVTGIRLKDVQSGEERTLEVDGVFPYIGHIPNSGLFAGQIDMDENGYVLTNHRRHTNVPGVFVAGDVADHIYRQAITAAGEGCQAAMEATWFLSEQEHLEKKARERHEHNGEIVEGEAVVEPGLGQW
jgi:thioredoxin reductase (NADPH)